MCSLFRPRMRVGLSRTISGSCTNATLRPHSWASELSTPVARCRIHSSSTGSAVRLTTSTIAFNLGLRIGLRVRFRYCHSSLRPPPHQCAQPLPVPARRTCVLERPMRNEEDGPPPLLVRGQFHPHCPHQGTRF